MRITAACPVGLIDDANMLAMIWGLGPDDGLTFHNCPWRDGAGQNYAVASWEAGEDWGDTYLVAPDADALEALRPGRDAPMLIDITAAARAQAVLEFWAQSDPPGPAPAADAGRLVLIAGLDATQALSALGLTRQTSS